MTDAFLFAAMDDNSGETDTESDVPSFRGLQEYPIQGTLYGLNGLDSHFDGNCLGQRITLDK